MQQVAIMILLFTWGLMNRDHFDRRGLVPQQTTETIVQQAPQTRIEEIKQQTDEINETQNDEGPSSSVLDPKIQRRKLERSFVKQSIAEERPRAKMKKDVRWAKFLVEWLKILEREALPQLPKVAQNADEAFEIVFEDFRKADHFPDLRVDNLRHICEVICKQSLETTLKNPLHCNWFTKSGLYRYYYHYFCGKDAVRILPDYAAFMKQSYDLQNSYDLSDCQPYNQPYKVIGDKFIMEINSIRELYDQRNASNPSNPNLSAQEIKKVVSIMVGFIGCCLILKYYVKPKWFPNTDATPQKKEKEESLEIQPKWIFLKGNREEEESKE